MRTLRAVRRRKPQLWVVHDTNVRPGDIIPQAAQVTIIEQQEEAVFEPEERPTQRMPRAQSILWDPEQPHDEQWQVFDLLKNDRLPLAKCSSEAEAQRVVRRVTP